MKDSGEENVYLETERVLEGNPSMREPVRTEEADESMHLRNRDTLRKLARYQANFVKYHMPASYEEAIMENDSEKWIKAIKDKLDALQRNET